MQQNFSAQKFRQALSQLNNNQQPLKPFINQCVLTKMSWILGVIQQLYDYLHNPKLSITICYNSLFAVKCLIDTGNVLLINMIEIYLLQKILKIASFDLYGVSQRRGFYYFIDKGFEGRRNQLEYFGHNFIRMANQIISAAAKIKPYLLVENQETKEPSPYQIALLKLKNKGIQPYKFNKFYSEKNIEDSRAAFKKNLNGYIQASQKCGAFYATIIKNYLQNKPNTFISKRQTPMNKIFKDGDISICKQVLRQCFTSLQAIDLNQRKKALMIINDFVKWGDILVSYAVNYLGVADQVIKEIADPHERATGSQRAKALLYRYGNSNDQKLSYYNQLLKSLQFWSRCFPFSLINPDTPSEMKLAFILLQQKLDVEFPEFMFDINESLAIFQFYSRKKQVRNERLLYVFQQNAYRAQVIPTLLPSMMNARMISKKMSIVDQQQTFKDLFGQFAVKTSFDSFKEELFKIRKIVQDLTTQQNVVKQYAHILKDFVNDFDAKIIQGNFNEHQMDFLITQGAPLVERVEDIMPVIDKYSKGYLSYPQLRSYLNSYSQENHSDHIQQIKLKKKETALIGMGLMKQKTVEQLPNLVLPYTQSQDRLEPSFYFKNRVDQMHKIESNARELFKINEEEMMNTKRSSNSNKGMVNIDGIRHLQSVEDSNNMVNIRNVRHLESLGDNFIELPRMTSLQSQMNRREEQVNHNSPLNTNNNPNTTSSNAANSRRPTKTNSQVMQKYGGGVLKITELHAEDQFDHSNSNINRFSRQTSGMSGQVYLSVESPVYTKKDRDRKGSKSDIIERLDKFMQVSSVKQQSNKDHIQNSYQQSEKSIKRQKQKENPLMKVRSNREPQTMKLASEVQRSKNKPYFNRTTSDIIEQSQEDSIRKLTNENSSKKKEKPTYEKQQLKTSNPVLKQAAQIHKVESSHRKSNSMDNPNSNYFDKNSVKMPASQPQQLNKRQKILKCLSPRRPKTDQDITTKEEEYQPRGRVVTSHNRMEAVNEDVRASNSGTNSSKLNFDMGNQIFVQRGFYKQKNSNISISSGSRMSEVRQKNKYKNI